MLGAYPIESYTTWILRNRQEPQTYIIVQRVRMLLCVHNVISMNSLQVLEYIQILRPMPEK